jgi:hypothetical protein
VFDHAVCAVLNLRKMLAKFGGRDIGEKSQPAQVHAQNRKLVHSHLPARPQDRSIAPEYDDEI